MNSDFDSLEEKIRRAREAKQKTPAQKQAEEDDKNKAQGIQAGFEFVGAIAISTTIGYFLDDWLGTKPLFFISLFFLGVFTGFYNIYRITQGSGTAVGFSRLHQTEKDAKKSPDSENTEHHKE